MTTLIVYGATDRPRKHDATYVFVPEARQFAERARARDESVVSLAYDMSDPGMSDADKRSRVERDVMRAPLQGVDHAVFVCHGFAARLETGHNVKTAGALAYALSVVASREHLAVSLMACSTMRDADAGFGVTLARELAKRGLHGWVDGHTVAGHATRCPYVRRVTFDGALGGSTTHRMLVESKHPSWSKWRQWLREDGRFEFSRMSDLQLRAAGFGT